MSDVLKEIEQIPAHWDDFACYTCLRLKPRSAFTLKQTKSPRGKVGVQAHKRFCVECGISTPRHRPSHVIKTVTQTPVWCVGCEKLQTQFCINCHWCGSCVEKGTATVLRKGLWAKPNGEASEVVLRNRCIKHVWGEVRPEPTE